MRKGLFFVMIAAVGLLLGQLSYAVTITGTIIDNDKVLHERLMQEGAKWNGEFDSITRSMTDIRALSGGSVVETVHPDEKGNYTLKLSGSIDAIALASSSGGFYMEIGGPWTSDSTVDLNVRTAGMYTIKGTVRGHNGGPAAYQPVKALDKDSKEITTVTTYSKGDYVIHSNVPIQYLKTYGKTIEGPWTSSAVVNLES